MTKNPKKKKELIQIEHFCSCALKRSSSIERYKRAARPKDRISVIQIEDNKDRAKYPKKTPIKKISAIKIDTRRIFFLPFFKERDTLTERKREQKLREMAITLPVLILAKNTIPSKRPSISWSI